MSEEELAPMLTETQLEVIQRQEELLALDTRALAKEVIVTALVREEIKSKGGAKRSQLSGMAQLLKLLMDMEGVGKASEEDVNIDLPKDAGKAIDTLIEKRSKGQLRSVQANDLAALLGKRADWEELSKLKEMLEEVQKKIKADSVIPIMTREEFDKKEEN